MSIHLFVFLIRSYSTIRYPNTNATLNLLHANPTLNHLHANAESCAIVEIIYAGGIDSPLVSS